MRNNMKDLKNVLAFDRSGYRAIDEARKEYLNKFLPGFQQIINIHNIFKFMTQLNFHNQNNESSNPPRSQFSLSLIQKLVQDYKSWHNFLPNFSKDSRYTIGTKIDSLFLETIELIIKASYSDKVEKLISLKNASVKLDLLKFFLQIAWEIKCLDNKKYILLSEKLDEIGKMLGGWIKALK